MSTDSKHLVILAAGTGGHVMPGLAVAKVMASRGWKISWVGTVAGMERGLVERHGIPFHALDFQGVRGRGPDGGDKGVCQMIGAVFARIGHSAGAASDHRSSDGQGPRRARARGL